MTRRILLTAGLVIIGVAVFATAALGDQTSYLNGKVRTGDTIVVPASETIPTDLYVFASSITIDGTVNGDLIAAGSTITVNGTVNGSIMAAGSVVNVNGATKGAVRAAGGQASLNGPIGRDAVVAAGQLSTTSRATIGQDLLFGSGTASIAGPVTGSILGSAGTYSRTGTIGGSEQVTLSSDTTRAATSVVRNPVFDAIRQLAAVLVLGVILLWLAPQLMTAWDRLVRTRPAATFGYGVLATIGFGVAIIAAFIAMIVFAIIFGLLTLGALVAVDIVGSLLLIGTAIFVFVIVCAFVVDAVVGYTLGRAILASTQLGLTDRWQALAELALGALIVVAIESIPVLGGIIGLVVVLVGLGALTLHFWERRPGTGRPAVAA